MAPAESTVTLGKQPSGQTAPAGLEVVGWLDPESGAARTKVVAIIERHISGWAGEHADNPYDAAAEIGREILTAFRRPAPTVEEVREAVYAWIREDASPAVQMSLLPHEFSKLVLRIHALWTGEKG